MTATEGQTAKVRRTKIAPCLTCPLCNDFYREATTISECLHTFCKECIWEKFRAKCETHCPVCDIDLGTYPLERTRPDPYLQDLRDKIFPHEEKRSKAPDSVPSDTKKKERSISSLGTSPKPKLSSRSSLVERRAKTAAKKFLDEQESALAAFQLEKRSAGKKQGRPNGVAILEGSAKNSSRTKSVARKKPIPQEYIASTSQHQPQKVAGDNKTSQEHSPIPKEYNPSASQPQPQKVAGDNKTDKEHSELETENMTIEIENQKTSLESDLNQQEVPNETSEKNAVLWKGKAPMWEPLNCLMEAAENAKSSESNNMQENANFAVPVESCNNDSNTTKIMAASDRNEATKIMAASDQNEATPVQPDPIKTKGLGIKHQRRVKLAQDLNVPAEPVPTGSSSQSNERIIPIWFSLVASEEGDVRARLPQMPYPYLRVRDVNLPIAFIKKYIVKKLDLASEAEVEISLSGKPLLPSLQLKDVVEMWIKTVPKSDEMIHSFVGDSAKDYMMVLSYSRKA
ncbi:hypothetical protein K1719_006190 [Acacia pycnantha]|nr:hypothetical protein K1719_006190 [Acacia pycnantha]